MSYALDLSSHGKQLKQLYDSIVSSDPSVAWAVFNYESQSNTLKPGSHGPNDGDFLQEFVEEFDDGKIQYGFIRVMYQNIPKFVLVGWVGEGVPERTKGYFNAHYSTVAKYFHGYHVQITARDSSGLSPAIIMAKVDTAVGSKYGGTKAVPLKPKYSDAKSGANEDDWGGAPQVVEKEELNTVKTAYRPTVVDMASLKTKHRVETPQPKKDSQSRGSVGNYSDPKSTYEPIGKVDIAALKAQGKNSPFASSRSEPLQSSYKPVGKVDIAAIRAQAAKSESYRSGESSVRASPKVADKKPEPASSGRNEDDDEEDEKPKSFKERMAAFSSGAPIKPAASATASESHNDEEEDTAPKSVKDRMNVFQGSGRLYEMPKPKVENKVGARFNPSGGRGTAPAIPKSLFGESRAAPGFKDYGSQGGKTPAQLWAEKHGKVSTSTAALPVTSQPDSNSSFTKKDLVQMEEQDLNHDEEESEEKSDFKDVRKQFENTSISGGSKPSFQPEEEEEREQKEEQAATLNSFADITSRFASPPAMPPRDGPSSSAAPPPPMPPRNEEPQEHTLDQRGRGIPSPPPQDNGIIDGRPEEIEGTPSEHETDVGRQQAIASAIAEGGPSESDTDLAGHGQPVTGLTAVAVFDYDKDEDNEIGLVEGEVITEIEKLDPDWWQGKNSKGEVGLFPSNYVELTDLAPGQEPHIVEVEEAKDKATVTPGPRARAEYAYDAQEEGELSFPEEAIIVDIDFVDEAWWSGTYNGETALFPSNYVELIE